MAENKKETISMSDFLNDKLQYDSPIAPIMIFPCQDILTTSNDVGIELPEDEW